MLNTNRRKRVQMRDLEVDIRGRYMKVVLSVLKLTERKVIHIA